MRYMMTVIADENFRASGPPPQALMDAIDQLGRAAGNKIVSMGGLQHSSKGAKVRVRGGKLTVTDGPFTEAKEVVGGYAIVETKTKDEAREVARRFMELHQIHWPEFECESEIRQIEEMS